MKSYEKPYGLWGKQGRGVWLVLVSFVGLLMRAGICDNFEKVRRDLCGRSCQG